MQRSGRSFRLSATDLVGHLNCSHLTSLNLQVLDGALERPQNWDPLLDILWERGTRHEAGYIAHLRSQGFNITVVDGVGIDDAVVAQTREAMVRGDQIIVQGAFDADGWVGRTDVLRRVESPSNLGAW